MKNNGSALLRESDTNFNNFPLGLSVLIVDHDQLSLQEMEANLRRFGYEVTECNRVEDASTLLRMEGSVFHIIIIEQCLLGVNEFELLRIGREIDLPVIVTSEDDKPDIVQRSLNYGACDYLLKPIPMSVLKMVWKYMFLKKDNKWAQVQQLTNNVSRVRNQRMSWTLDSHEKFLESVQKLGGIDNASPKKILQLLQSNFKGFEDVGREQISSHLQKYRDSLKKKAQLGYRDKDGTSSEHSQSRYQMEEHPPMTSVNQVLKTTVANESDILSEQQQAPAAKNTQGFQSVTLTFETNLPTIGGSTRCGNQSNALMIQMDEAFSSEQMSFVTLPFETNLPTIGGSTSCGNQSSALMTQMDEAFSSEQMRNEFTGGQPVVYESFLNDIDASTNDIFGDPGIFSINAPVLSPFHIDHGEYGFSSDGIFENFTGNVIAREHFNL